MSQRMQHIHLVQANDEAFFVFFLLIQFNDRIIIKHIRTNKALALEPDHSARNLFGLDVQISANTYYDSHKAERDVNVWTLRAAGTVDSESEVKQMVTSEMAEDVAMENTVADGHILHTPEKA
ncbi:unnamed protein product [Dicrocoelium dendriticum]|nr:unnamed protein product [Dicrocoelium dendriticum]